MKKLSFFLMAMLMSVMSFAQVVTFSPANETAVESQTFTLTSGDVTLVCSSGTITADQFRFFKNQTVTISSTGGNIVSVEFTCTASDGAKYGPGCFTTTSGDYTYAGKVGTWTGEANEVKFTASSNQVRATQVVVTLLAAGGVPQPSIQGATDFIESAEVSIVASEGLKVYYTLDGTDPTTESTEYTAPFTVEETTTVKAIAHDGTNASDVTETTFTKATKVTCAEAAEIASQLSGNNVLSDLYYVVVGYVTELDGTISNGQQKFWVSDTKGGANTLYSYWCNVPQELVVGDYIQMFGKLTKYYEKNQMKNGDVTILEEPTPEPVKYTVTVTAENGTVEGAGEYEEGATATLTATANEGYEFVNWTVGEEVVSTENPYTFTVTADVALVANFKEVEPEYDVMDITMTNLVVEEMEDFVVLTASDDSNTGLNVMLAVNEDGSLAADSYMAMVQGWSEVELPIVEGKITKAYNEELATDVYSGLVVVEYMEGKLGLNLTMYAKPVVATDVVVTDATITIETEDDGVGGTYEIINIAANWNGSVLEIEGVEKEFEGFVQIKQVIDEATDDWYIWMCMNGVITTVDNVLTVTGEFKNNWTGDVYNVTISGTLPVVEPTTITYELNGGELPKVKVPTNAELWGTDTTDVNGLMHYFNHYHNLKRSAQDISADVSTNPVATFLTGMPDEAGVFVDEESKYKWLGDYIIKVTNDQIAEGKLSVLKAVDSNIKWRYGVQAFFMCLPATDSNYKGWADFTEAGKPEAWGAAYQAANELVLPTEPVDAPYTLPTPVKEGYTFVGWYDNAEGTGEAYTVIPAGWAGTLYAIWEVEGPATALENIAVEGKAVKAIINGQLIIIKNGVQYNAQGQVVK